MKNILNPSILFAASLLQDSCNTTNPLSNIISGAGCIKGGLKRICFARYGDIDVGAMTVVEDAAGNCTIPEIILSAGAGGFATMTFDDKNTNMTIGKASAGESYVSTITGQVKGINCDNWASWAKLCLECRLVGIVETKGCEKYVLGLWYDADLDEVIPAGEPFQLTSHTMQFGNSTEKAFNDFVMTSETPLIPFCLSGEIPKITA